MSENLQEIDKLFKTALDNAEETPSPKVWDQLDKNLDKHKVVDISQKYSSLKKLAVAMVVIICGFSMYEILNLKTSTSIVKKKTEWQYPNGKQNENEKQNQKQADQNKPGADPSKLKEQTIEQNLTKNPNEFTTEAGSVANIHEKQETLNNIDSLFSGQLERTSRYSAQEENKEMVKPTRRQDEIKRIIPWNKKRNNDKPIIRKTNEPALIENNIDATPARELMTFQSAPDFALLDLISTNNIAAYLPDSIDNKKLASLFPIVSTANSISKSKAAKTMYRSTHVPKFSATVFFSPDHSGYRLVRGTRDFRDEDKDEIQQREQHAFSSTSGVLVNYNINSKIAVQSGLYLSSTVIIIDPKTVYARPDRHGNVRFRYNCSSGYSYLPSKPGNMPASGDSTTVEGSKNTLKYMSIPVSLRYNFTQSKLNLNTTFGMAYNILINQRIETEFQSSGKTVTDIEGLKSGYFNGLLSVAAEYSLNNNIAFSVAPTARIAFSSINRDAPVKSYPRSYGLSLGLLYKF